MTADPRHARFWFNLRYDRAADGSIGRSCQIDAAPTPLLRDLGHRLYLRADGEERRKPSSGEWRLVSQAGHDAVALLGAFAPRIEAIFDEHMARIASVVVQAGPTVLKDGLRGELGFALLRTEQLRPSDALIFTIRPLDGERDFLRSWRHSLGWSSGGGVIPDDDDPSWARIQAQIDERVDPEVATMFDELEEAYGDLVARTEALAG